MSGIYGILRLDPQSSLRGWKIILEPSAEHALYIFPLSGNTIFFDDGYHYRIIDFDSGIPGIWKIPPTSNVAFPPCMVEVSKNIEENTQSSIRLSYTISNGWVYKFQVSQNVEGESEHALHILISGLIRRHAHQNADGITEGYRYWDITTGQPGEWEVVGAGMDKTFHEIPFKSGLQLVEGSKRGPGIQYWPELQQKF